MKETVRALAHGYNDKDGRYVEYCFTIYESGSKKFLEVQMERKEIFTVELCSDERKVRADALFPALEEVSLLAKMTEMVKDAGLWKPKFQPGDVVLVDKPGSLTVKVIDPMTQTSETVDKKQVIIEKDECSCSLRTLMSVGCQKTRTGACEVWVS